MVINKKKIMESAECKTAADVAVETIIWFAIELIRKIENGSVSTSEDIVSVSNDAIERVKRFSVE